MGNGPRLPQARTLGACPYLVVNKKLILDYEMLMMVGIGPMIAPSVARRRSLPLKKLLLLACLIVVLAPHSASAQYHRRHMKADEMAGMGVGAAALVGAAGYLLLRRRNAE
jgi:hypothetical protein